MFSPATTADELERSDSYPDNHGPHADSGDDEATEASQNFLPNVLDSDLGALRMEGWLNHTTSSRYNDIQKNTSSILLKTKKQTKRPRYFVLRGSTLSYYTRRHDVKAKGTFVLTRGCSVGPVVHGSLEESIKIGCKGQEHANFSSATSGVTDSNTSNYDMSTLSADGKSKKKKNQLYCIQISWPIHYKPSKDEKDMAQAKAQVAAENEKEALQQQQHQETSTASIASSKYATSRSILQSRHSSLCAPSVSTNGSPKTSPRRILKTNQSPSPSLHNEHNLHDVPPQMPHAGEHDAVSSIKNKTLLLRPHHRPQSSTAATDTTALRTPSNALLGTTPFRPSFKEGEDETAGTQTGSSPMNHETGLHKHYTQVIEKQAKDQQKSQEELEKVMLLLSQKATNQKYKKKIIQGTKVVAVSSAAITAGVLTAGIGLAAGLVFVGITAAAGGSGAVVGSKVLDKAKGKYQLHESKKSFHLLLGAHTYEEAMQWKSAMEFVIQELVLATGDEGEDLNAGSISHYVDQETSKWRVITPVNGSESHGVEAANASLLQSPLRNTNQMPSVKSPVKNDVSVRAPYLDPAPKWVPIQGGGLALGGVLGALGGGGNLRIYKEERSPHSNSSSPWFFEEANNSAFPRIPRFRSEVGLVGQPFSPLKSSIVLKANSLDAFMCLMCSGRIVGDETSSVPVPNSGQIASFRIIETMDEHMDVIHLVFRPLYLFPSWTAPRDFVLYRFWKYDDDGTYQICLDSNQHRDCPPQPGYVRGQMHSVCTIAPLKQKKKRSSPRSTAGSAAGRSGARSNLSNDECMLSQVAQVDPCGWVPTSSSLPFLRSQGYGDAFAIMALHQMLDVKDALDSARFVAVPMDDSQNFGPHRSGVNHQKRLRKGMAKSGTWAGHRNICGTKSNARGETLESLLVPTLEAAESCDMSDDEEPDAQNYDFSRSTELPRRDSDGNHQVANIPSSDRNRNDAFDKSSESHSSSNETGSTIQRTISSCPPPTVSEWWGEPDANSFRVRGKTYIKDKVKINAGTNLFRLVAADIVETDVPIMTGMCLHPKERVQLALKREIEAKRSGCSSTDMPPFVFAVNISLPGPPSYHKVFYYAVDDMSKIDGSDGTPSSKLCQKFFFGDDDTFRDNTFKIIPQIIEGNFMVRKAVGSTPAIMGTKIKQTYVRGDRFFELMIDTGSSAVAAGVIRICLGYSKMIVVDLAFLFEGYDESTLPERVLGCVRLKNVEFNKRLRFVESVDE